MARVNPRVTNVSVVDADVVIRAMIVDLIGLMHNPVRITDAKVAVACQAGYTCPLCYVGFSQRSQLLAHINSAHAPPARRRRDHTDMYGCGICDVRCIDMKSILSHMDLAHASATNQKKILVITIL